tara:strand:- start:188 stop:1006 length:819 start_codon:yes stop_codon:yes gene_type:complete
MSIFNLGVSQREPFVRKQNPLLGKFENPLPAYEQFPNVPFPAYEEFANVPFPAYENFIGSYSQVDPSAPMYEEFGVGSPNSLRGLDLNRFKGIGSLNVGGFDKLGTEGTDMKFNQPTGIAKIAQFLPFGDKSLLRAGLNIVKDALPKADPRAISMRNFYGNRFGLTGIGQVASGPMKGYNPVSGGLFGREKTFGLEKAIGDRIKVRTDPKTLARVAKFSDARKAKFFEKTKQLQDLVKDERGSKSLDKAFDKDRTREKDLRGGSGKDFGPYS